MNRNNQSYFKLGGIRPPRTKSKTPIVIMAAICVFSITYAIFLIFLAILHSNNASKNNTYYYPMVIATWDFVKSTEKAWEKVYADKSSALDAVEEGCKVCQELQCDGTVGYGGSPDENGETTLEAMIMDGATMNVGAVANLRRVKNVIGVARHVLHYTQHSILAGDLATEFAIKMNFKEEPLSTNTSTSLWKEWKENKCQPNFWTNVSPDPTTSCGPYSPKRLSNWWHVDNEQNKQFHIFGRGNHDTIGIIVIDGDNNIAAGTSTNGAKYKIPGRVGDSPIPGAGAYADNDVGAAACTGDGDIMLRFLPSFLAVEELRRGSLPGAAAATAINRIAEKYPSFVGGIVVVNKEGTYGAACHGLKSFPYTVSNKFLGQATVNTVDCINTEL